MGKGEVKQFLLLPFFLIFCACSSETSQSGRLPDAVAQLHIQALVATLPPDSSVRRTLEAGKFGDGIRERWMDTMQREGLKEVVFEVHGVWRSWFGFKPQSVSRVIYRTQYDGPGAQLNDIDRIARIRTSGLEAMLQEAAFRKARNARWFFESRTPSLLGINSFVDVYLFEDEWVTDVHRRVDTLPLGAYSPSEVPLTSAAEVGDSLSVSDLLKHKSFSRKDLDNALFAAITYPSDNTDVIRILIKAGADPNAAQRDGTSVLMESISFLNASNIRLLLASGANRSQKNLAGETAFSMLRKRINAAQGPMPTYSDQVAQVLDPDRSPTN